MSIRVDLAGSKIVLTSAKMSDLKNPIHAYSG